MFEDAFARAATLTGTPVDYLKLFSLLIVAYPLALPLPSLSPTVKHLVNVGVSSIFFIPVLNLHNGFAQLLGTSLATYAAAYLKIGGRKMPWIVFVGQMAHLTANHLVRHYGNIPLTTIEITSMQMVLCMNLTTFAWDVYDGQLRREEDCDESQKKTRITKMPSILEFLGYCFYFPGVLIGPSTRFTDYQAWSKGTLYNASTSSSEDGAARVPPSEKRALKAAGKSLKSRSAPVGRYRAAALEIATGLAFMAVYSLYSGKWSYEKLVISPHEGGVTHWPLWKAIGFMQIAGLVARTKYYGVWSLTNGACILSGLGFNGTNPKTGNSRWDRCKNIDIPKIEFANNWKELLDHWNMNTNVWLRNNVYKRLVRRGRKPGFKTTMVTFLTSAFWHGVAPGYYLAFFLGGLLQSVARSLRRHVRPIFFSDPKAENPALKTLGSHSFGQLMYSALSILSVQLTLNFTAAPFLLLELGKSWRGWQSVGFYGLVMTLVGMAAFRAGLGRWCDGISGRQRIERKQKKVAATAGSGLDDGGTATETEVDTDHDRPGGNGSTGKGTSGRSTAVRSAGSSAVHRDLPKDPRVPDVDAAADEALAAAGGVVGRNKAEL